MVDGLFVENIPLIRIVIGWGRNVEVPFVVLDTGFTGDLQVTSQIAKNLGLQVTGVTKTQIANGQTIDMPVALALASMEGETQSIEVLISDSMSLIGISFLSKFSYKAIVDCKHKTVQLERV